MDGELTNPWIRANLETFDVDTLNLVPPGLREDYTRIMKELAHSRSIVALAIERMYVFETERRAFFEWIGAIPQEATVTDINEYRQQKEDWQGGAA